MVTVSFPGLGIEPFTFDKVALRLPIFGGIEVRWYGIIIVTGIILAFLYATWRAKQSGIVLDDMLDIAIWAVLFGMIGARTYYVLTSLDEFDSFWEALAIWNGGIAIYGSIIGGAAAILVVCRIKKLKWQTIFDCVSPGVMIGQILGRWGNFFNGEAYGETPAEGSPLYFLRMGLQHEGWKKEIFYQPTFLYESLWNLIGFLLIHFTYKKKKFEGQIFLEYITWYGFGRMLIEGLRTDSLYIGVFRISQVVGFCCFVIGGTLLIILSIRAKKQYLATEADYDSVYGNLVRERAENAPKVAVPAPTDTPAAEAPAPDEPPAEGKTPAPEEPTQDNTGEQNDHAES